MFLLFLESTSEIFFILIVGLILFGPRKLPQLSRTIGKSLAEFKRASEEFKRTWENEVAMESSQKDARIEEAMIQPDSPATEGSIERGNTLLDSSRGSSPAGYSLDTDPNRIAETVPSNSLSNPLQIPSKPEPPAGESAQPEALVLSRKQDWL